MSRIAYQVQTQALNVLVGEVCIRTAKGDSRTLLLDFRGFGVPDPRGIREPELSFVAECPWRLEDHTSVVVRSGDDPERITSESEVLIGSRVKRFEVIDPSFAVRLYFEQGYCLWVFPDNSRDYAEQGDDPSVHWYVAGRLSPSRWEDP